LHTGQHTGSTALKASMQAAQIVCAHANNIGAISEGGARKCSLHAGQWNDAARANKDGVVADIKTVFVVRMT
jgi:hypothetical protein